MIAGAPYDLHCSPAAVSLSGSQAFPIRRPSLFSGMLAKSPLIGVTMRHRQSSETTETQYPVKSAGAAACADLGGCGGPAGPNPGPGGTPCAKRDAAPKER